MFTPTQQQIAVTSTLVCCALVWLGWQQKNSAVSVIYLASLGLAVVLYSRASIFLRESLRESLDMSGKEETEQSLPLRRAYERTNAMVNRVFIFIVSTVVTVPAYALVVPESRAAGLGIRPAVPSVFALLALKLEFGIIVACIAAYCVEPYRLRVMEIKRRTEVNKANTVIGSSTSKIHPSQ
jgi:hypothetical protein